MPHYQNPLDHKAVWHKQKTDFWRLKKEIKNIESYKKESNNIIYAKEENFKTNGVKLKKIYSCYIYVPTVLATVLK